MMKVFKGFRFKKMYSYAAKFYKGVPVLTLVDIEHMTHVSRYDYLACIKQNHSQFLKGIDYWYLKDSLLKEFLYENPNVSMKKRGLFIVSYSGLLKLMDVALTENMKRVKVDGKAGGGNER